MRFSIIYQNRSEIRDEVVRLVLTAIHSGHKLQEQSIRHMMFASQPNWPPSAELYALPINYQCEEFEFLDGSLRTLRTLVIDAEVIEPTVVPVTEGQAV